MRLKCLKCGQGYDATDEHHCSAAAARALATRMTAVEAAGLEAGSCPTCGRPFPKTAAERQRAYRERKRGR